MLVLAAHTSRRKPCLWCLPPPSPAKDKKAEPPEPGSIMEPGSHQSVAVLGLALIAMGEEIGAEMSLRQFSHLVSELLTLLAPCGADSQPSSPGRRCTMETL